MEPGRHDRGRRYQGTGSGLAVGLPEEEKDARHQEEERDVPEETGKNKKKEKKRVVESFYCFGPPL